MPGKGKPELKDRCLENVKFAGEKMGKMVPKGAEEEMEVEGAKEAKGAKGVKEEEEVEEVEGVKERKEEMVVMESLQVILKKK